MKSSWLVSGLFVSTLLVASACGGGGSNESHPDAAVTPPAADAAPPDAAPLEPPTDPIQTPFADWHACSDTDEIGATVVLAHDHVNQNNGSPSTRNVDATVQLPTGDWQQVFMRVEVTCPDNFCDVWDRAASISLIEDEGATKKRLELARWMTAYGKGFCFMADVTDLSSHLSGQKTVRSFVDTWVGPTDNQNGHGWQVTTKFIYRAGTRDTDAYAAEVIPVWNVQPEERLIRIGDPDKPISTDAPDVTVSIPADAKKVALRYLITGHGQGGANNCAEFCTLFYRTRVALSKIDILPWRPNCNVNPLHPQNGTWQYARAGWCPGSFVEPTIVDITDKVTPGTDTKLSFDVVDESGAPFVNTCRTGAGNAQNVCTGCVFDGQQSSTPGNCEENGNGHTPAEGRVSVEMLIYK
jgi:hypothetical protein